MAPSAHPLARTLLSPLGFLAAALFTGGVAAAGCIIDWADDCGHNRDAPNCKGGLVGTAGVGGTGAGGTGSSSSGSVDGGDGGPMGCVDAGSCPQTPPPGLCPMVATCTNDVCGFAFIAGPALSQQYGSCQQNVCDANGKMTSIELDSNKFDNGNACEPYQCVNAAPVPNFTSGTACAWMGTVMGVCEPSPDPQNTGNYFCAECDPHVATSCMSTPAFPFCRGGLCVPSHCADALVNAGETDLNCGGNVTNMSGCLPCGIGLNCVDPSDCFSGVCAGTPSTCQAPTCSDNVKNGTETAIDCGGNNPACKRCQPGRTCLQPSDCTSTVCMSTTPGQPATCQAPNCTDGVKNGGETGIDCGGFDGDAGCPPCVDGGP